MFRRREELNLEVITIKKVITALLNSKVNEELQKDREIEVIGNDLLYQEAVLECIEENEDIDFILLNENLPGDEIENFIRKIEKIKTIIFTEISSKNKKKFEEIGVYKVYENGEISIEEIKEIIKENNYTEQLEKEIKKLKKMLIEKEEKQRKSVFNLSFLNKVKPKRQTRFDKTKNRKPEINFEKNIKIPKEDNENKEKLKIKLSITVE